MNEAATIIQGDVFFCQLPADHTISATARPVPVEARGLVIAEGEATGHAHVITDPGARMVEENGQFILIVDGEQVEMRHNTHQPVTLPRGRYRVGYVQEYNPWKEIARRIQD